MVTTEVIGVDNTGKMINCSPTSYKIPNVRSIPRKFNVTLMKNHDVVRTIYSSKVTYHISLVIKLIFSLSRVMRNI